jgi:hypothetical protein
MLGIGLGCIRPNAAGHHWLVVSRPLLTANLEAARMFLRVTATG